MDVSTSTVSLFKHFKVIEHTKMSKSTEAPFALPGRAKLPEHVPISYSCLSSNGL